MSLRVSGVNLTWLAALAGAVLGVAVLQRAVWAQEQGTARFDPFNPRPWLVGTLESTSPTTAPTTLDLDEPSGDSLPTAPTGRTGSPTVPGGFTPTKSIRLDINYLDDLPVRSPYRP